MLTMKFSRLTTVVLAVALASLSLAGCKKSSGSSSIPSTLTNYTWESGSSVANYGGNFGTQGTAASTNYPSGRSGAMTWKDSKGQFWLFSGSGGYSDMWMFNTTTLYWTCESGVSANPNSSNAGIYGTMGTAAATNLPGARTSGASWTDSSGLFWMFGGYGTDGNGAATYMNDLWTFSPTTYQWTWVGGSSAGGTPAATNAGTTSPTPRSTAATWTDSSGNFWLFGGQDYEIGSGSGVTGYQNDLWKFNPTSQQWTKVSSTGAQNGKGTYGTQGTASATNIPGARQQATSWIDSAGNLWLFGGTGYDSAGALGQLNDVWKYNPTAGTWTWVTGSSTINAVGNYGTNDVAASTNQPGARSGAFSWTDSSGNQWLFGGIGINSSGTVVVLNDLWELQTATSTTTTPNWVWINGSYNGNVAGYYGSLTVLSSSNMPGSRSAAATWTDSSNNFWMFGGSGYDASGVTGRLGDMWKYVP